MNSKELKFHQSAKPGNPLFLKVWERLAESGKLDDLSDDDVLEKVATTTEQLLKMASENKLGVETKNQPG